MRLKGFEGLKHMTGFHGSKFGSSTPRGFTILEVLIALFVATVGLISLSSMQATAIKGNGASNESTRATFLAQGMLERIKDGNMVKDGTFGYIDMAGIEPGMIQDFGLFAGIDEKGEKGGPFNLQWQVANHTDWSRRVTVNVSWNSILGITRNVSLTSVSRGDGS